MSSVSNADLVIEAVPEILALKQSIFSNLDNRKKYERSYCKSWCVYKDDLQFLSSLCRAITQRHEELVSCHNTEADLWINNVQPWTSIARDEKVSSETTKTSTKHLEWTSSSSVLMQSIASARRNGSNDQETYSIAHEIENIKKSNRPILI